MDLVVDVVVDVVIKEAAGGLLQTIGPMKRQRLNKLSLAKRAELNRQLKDIVEAGLIRPSHNEFESPILFDYRGINEVTHRNAYPLPRVDHTLDELKNANIYTDLDLAFGFWQVRVSDEDIHMITFHTHDGLMEWVAMPFGLSNARATYVPTNDQQHPARLLYNEFVRVYFDDVCVYNRTLEEHFEHLRRVRRKA
jgi:hypothetical protein